MKPGEETQDYRVSHLGRGGHGCAVRFRACNRAGRARPCELQAGPAQRAGIARARQAAAGHPDLLESPTLSGKGAAASSSSRRYPASGRPCATSWAAIRRSRGDASPRSSCASPRRVSSKGTGCSTRSCWKAARSGLWPKHRCGPRRSSPRACAPLRGRLTGSRRASSRHAPVGDR